MKPTSDSSQAPISSSASTPPDNSQPHSAQSTGPQKLPKLWNRNVFLLWQGQVVSAVGDVFYQVALGFWVLAVTGSTGLMGTLMAASTLPRVFLGPFAGVVVDRLSRKWILVLMDLVRGVLITLVAILAYMQMLEIWMVFVAGIMIGVCAAFFDPAVRSSIPDIVAKQRLLQGNSVFAMIESLSGILGNSLGGIIYTFLGAPLMFLINGLSYLFSFITELFLKIPRVIHENPNFHYWQDMRQGFAFIKKTPTLGLFFVNVGLLNFFLSMGGVLFLPFFQRTPGLGPAQYGIAMAVLTAGSVASLLLLSSLRIPTSFRVPIFIVGSSIFALSRTLLFIWNSMAIIVMLLFIIGFTVAVVNSIVSTTMQIIIPPQMRGKVFGLMGAMGGGLVPIGMALGGILAEFISIKVIITLTGCITALGFLPVFLSAKARSFIATDEPATPDLPPAPET